MLLSLIYPDDKNLAFAVVSLSMASKFTKGRISEQSKVSSRLFEFFRKRANKLQKGKFLTNSHRLNLSKPKPLLRTKRPKTVGDKISKGEKIADIKGSAKYILMGERTALNYIQRMSGIATETRKYQDAIGEFKAKIVDTRKTTPLFRAFEKYAVKTEDFIHYPTRIEDRIFLFTSLYNSHSFNDFWYKTNYYIQSIKSKDNLLNERKYLQRI